MITQSKGLNRFLDSSYMAGKKITCWGKQDTEMAVDATETHSRTV